MTTVLDPTPPSVLDVLRGVRSTRPPLDRTSAAGLRAMIEDGIYAIMRDERPTSPLVVRASALRQPWSTTNVAASPLGRLRGVLVNQLLRLLSVGARVDDPYGDAVRVWRSDRDDDPLTDDVAQLDEQDRARLATEVRAHYETLTNSLGVVSSLWLPRSAVRASQSLAGGAVVLRDVVDLMIGTTYDETSSVALLDITTSPLTESDDRVTGFHALVHTLRTTSTPLRTSMLSTATGDLRSRDVDFALLSQCIDDVLAAICDQWVSR